jgi:hypothetical protein
VRPAVASIFPSWTDGLEGHTSWMYLDEFGYVTTGRGNLIDSPDAALALPWQHKDGTPATPAEVTAEWQRVKALQAMRVRGGMVYAGVTTLRLSEAAIDALTEAMLRVFEAALVKRFPSFPGWPADAQLGALGMSWAMGGGFEVKFPHWSAAADEQDFSGCASECRISNGTPQRNAAHQTLFLNAACVLANPGTYDPSTLYYPRQLVSEGAGPAAMQ